MNEEENKKLMLHIPSKTIAAIAAILMLRNCQDYYMNKNRVNIPGFYHSQNMAPSEAINPNPSSNYNNASETYRLGIDVARMMLEKIEEKYEESQQEMVTSPDFIDIEDSFLDGDYNRRRPISNDSSREGFMGHNNLLDIEQERRTTKSLDSLGYVINSPNKNRDRSCLMSNSCQSIEGKDPEEIVEESLPQSNINNSEESLHHNLGYTEE